jgi:hypothetical protein
MSASGNGRLPDVLDGEFELLSCDALRIAAPFVGAFLNGGHCKVYTGQREVIKVAPDGAYCGEDLPSLPIVGATVFGIQNVADFYQVALDMFLLTFEPTVGPGARSKLRAKILHSHG